jgi:chromosome segregation ATPase
MLIGVLILGESAGLIYFAYKSQDCYKKSQGLSKELEEIRPGYEKLSKEEGQFKNQYADLLKEDATIKEDRNNLLAQAKSLLIDRNRAKELEGSLEKSTKDMQLLEEKKEEIRNQNQKLQEMVKQLMAAQNTIAEERDRFKGAYEKSSQNTVILGLKNEARTLQKEKNNAEGQLKKTKKDIEQLQGQKSKLEAEREQLSKQLEELKENYAQALKKNRGLEQEIKNTPTKFTEIARQNKILIKETAKMHYNLGVFYTRNKEYNRAIAEFEKVVEITPEDTYAHFNLGYIYAEYLLNRKKAVEHFRYFLRLARSDDKDVDWVRRYLLTWETYDGKKTME